MDVGLREQASCAGPRAVTPDAPLEEPFQVFPRRRGVSWSDDPHGEQEKGAVLDERVPLSLEDDARALAELPKELFTFAGWIAVLCPLFFFGVIPAALAFCIVLFSLGQFVEAVARHQGEHVDTTTVFMCLVDLAVSIGGFLSFIFLPRLSNCDVVHHIGVLLNGNVQRTTLLRNWISASRLRLWSHVGLWMLCGAARAMAERDIYAHNQYWWPAPAVSPTVMFYLRPLAFMISSFLFLLTVYCLDHMSFVMTMVVDAFLFRCSHMDLPNEDRRHSFSSMGSHESNRSSTASPVRGPRPSFACRAEWVPDEQLQRKVKSCGWKRSISSSSGLRSSAAKFLSEKSHYGKSPHRFVLHPHSNFCFIWDLANIMFIVYEVIVTPLQVLVVPDTRLLPFMEYFTAIFWSFDLLLTFARAIYVRGEIVWSRRQIAMEYFRTWFLFDVLVLFPDYVTLLSGSDAVSALVFLRVMRLFRLVRLLRFLKMERVIHSLQARINSATFLHLCGILRLVMFICVLNHLLACVWYQIGVSSDDGWAKDNRSERDALFGYVMSLHWSITQFHGSMEVAPHNLRERVFAVVVVLLALVIFSQFLSSLTDMMIQLQRLRHDKTRRQHALRSFLTDHDISSQLSMSAKKYIESEVDMARKQADEIEVLQSLPRAMLMDLYNEARTPLLSAHDLFKALRFEHPRAIRMMCFEAVSQRTIHVGETVFSSGDPCSRMFFIEYGSLIYTLDSRMAMVRRGSRSSSKSSVRRWKLRKGEWLCEISLWAVWSNVGELSAHRNCLLLEIDAAKLALVLKHFERAYLNTVSYAEEFISLANQCQLATDLELVVPDETVHRSLSKESGIIPLQRTGMEMGNSEGDASQPVIGRSI